MDTRRQFHWSIIYILRQLKLILLLKHFVVLRALLDDGKWLLLLLNKWNREAAVGVLIFLASFVAAAECARMSVVGEL